MIDTCPLCSDKSVSDYHQDNYRRYFKCGNCMLVFADPSSLLPPEQEKARYDLHQNNPDDMRYREFLQRLVNPLVQRLGKKGLNGLDFGCGPGPTLSVMLEEMGYSMSIYDPYYAKENSVLCKKYDFLTCSEAIEHFYTPGKQWRLMLDMLKAGGWLAIMTKLVKDAEAFKKWHYIKDQTHVSFFSRETFCYLAEKDELNIEFIGDDVILFRKPY